MDVFYCKSISCNFLKQYLKNQDSSVNKLFEKAHPTNKRPFSWPIIIYEELSKRSNPATNVDMN